MYRKTLKRFGNSIRWLFSAPFQNLPREFGDPVPPDLRAFEGEAEEIEHSPQSHIPPSSTVPQRTNSGR